ncbi:MAG: HpaII family restriction endonuclease [Bacteroidetes bacterium]|nr:HpaII family restriction endonuclease [Bacteroidota bacterium]
MLTGNKGEWSEPYALLKLLADGKLFLGGENFSKIKGLFYPIVKILRHEKERIIEFSYSDSLIIISDEKLLFKVPINDFVKNAKLCFEKIKNSKKGKGSFEIPEIEEFLSSFSIYTLKAKSKQKNDITIQIEDPNTFITPSMGFSIKSQLGRPSTLVNASGATNFTYIIAGKKLTGEKIEEINKTREFSRKFKLLAESGASLQHENVENNIFKSNLQTIDYNFEKILSEILVLFYSNDISSENTIPKFINKVSSKNSFGYDLKINSSMYELIMKKFLTDYALGMRAAEVWKRDYQATGGYLIVKDDGEIICYHFYFTKNFEDYLFSNTRLETPDPEKHGFGQIYPDKGVNKIKLNLQIRFIK